VVIFLHFREESKPDSDLDEPWIMTVKGLNHHNFKNQSMMNDDIMGSPIKQHNGSNNGSARDLNLNHYKINNQVNIYYF
jgi:serine/threonine-protein kinase 24/25/MST4